MPSTPTPTRRAYLAAGAVAGGAALAGGSAVLGSGADDPPTVGTLDGAWPQAGYDAANTGHSPDAAGPSGPVGPAWEFETDARSDWTPAVADGTVYLLDEDGVVYAVDARTGEQRWRTPTGHRTSTEQSYSVTYSVAVADGTVFVNGRDLVALDAADGSERWRAEIGTQVTSPTVADGVVYVGTHAGHYGLAAFDAADGRKLWQFEPDHAVFKSAPAVADGVLYASQSWTTGEVYAVDAADGTERWSRRVGSSPYPSPVVADGRVFAVSTNQPRMVVFDADSGRREWTVPGEDGSFAAPAVRDGTAYYGEGDGTIRALDATDGSERWRFGVEGPFSNHGHLYPSPVLAGGNLYLTAFDADLRPSQGQRRLYAVDAGGGTDLLGWHVGLTDWRAEGEGWPWTGPVVVDDAVFVGTGKGVVALAAGE